MDWINFSIYAIVAMVLWLFASLVFITKLSKKNKTLIASILTALGILSVGLFITVLWVTLDRPPMRTSGETRLWYSLFLPIIGLITYLRWRYAWFLIYTAFLASVFLMLNMMLPETHNKTLMPALQSIWFVPHVLVYMFSYAFIGASWVIAIYGVWQMMKKREVKNTLLLADNIIYSGFAFLTMGLLFGALWAKEAWGHYWTWDPKETWAYLTFLVYLVYIHHRYHHPKKIKVHLIILSLSFAVLLLAWFGVNYMPSAKNSVHTYTEAE